jgi:hypothetical protein
MRSIAYALVVCAAACGPTSKDDDPDSGTDVPVVDYDSGTWYSEVAVDTPGTISHGAAGVFLANGAFLGTWMEPDVDATSGEDIWEFTHPAGGAWANKRLSDDGSAQAAYNSMATDGTTTHLIYNSAPGDDNDLYYSKNTGSSWSARVDVTSPAETGTARHEFQTDIALAPNGDAVVAFISASEKTGGGINPDGEVRIMTISPSGTASAAITVIPTPGGVGCFDPSVVVDSAGTVHVAADCGQLGGEDVLYTENSGGSYATPMPFPNGTSSDDVGVQLALGPDHETLHAVWSKDAECLYMRKRAGGAWTTAVSASNSPGTDDRSCMLGVDPNGRVLAAWHSPNAQNNEDVLFSWSADGLAFKAAKSVTPDTSGTVEWFPSVILFEATTGLPHIIYERIVAMSNPLNTQVMHAVMSTTGSPL